MMRETDGALRTQDSAEAHPGAVEQRPSLLRIASVDEATKAHAFEQMRPDVAALNFLTIGKEHLQEAIGLAEKIEPAQLAGMLTTIARTHGEEGKLLVAQMLSSMRSEAAASVVACWKKPSLVASILDHLTAEKLGDLFHHLDWHQVRRIATRIDPLTIAEIAETHGSAGFGKRETPGPGELLRSKKPEEVLTHLEGQPAEKVIMLLNSLEPKAAREVFAKMPFTLPVEQQIEIIEQLPIRAAASGLASMKPDIAASHLEVMATKEMGRASRILGAMDRKAAAGIVKTWDSETAAQILQGRPIKTIAEMAGYLSADHQANLLHAMGAHKTADILVHRGMEAAGELLGGIAVDKALRLLDGQQPAMVVELFAQVSLRKSAELLHAMPIERAEAVMAYLGEHGERWSWLSAALTAKSAEIEVDRHASHAKRWLRKIRASLKDMGAGEAIEDPAAKRFLLETVQPSLAGGMDGSASTLAPLFSSFLVTRDPFTAFRVGMATALGGGISMAMAEMGSDDGERTGRGSAMKRSLYIGGSTFLAAALHTLPFLISNFNTALLTATLVTGGELGALTAVRKHFFGGTWRNAAGLVIGGNAVSFAAAWLLGGA
ncbi:MAG: hypothetical protein J2P37_04480 [Ktedonobacteraceae bacterium]|nr:hypothetical protein [Ktedonobacteraceae bacterium]